MMARVQRAADGEDSDEDVVDVDPTQAKSSDEGGFSLARLDNAVDDALGGPRPKSQGGPPRKAWLEPEAEIEVRGPDPKLKKERPEKIPQEGIEEEDGPSMYCVAQGIIFHKPSENPRGKKILKNKRDVGYLIHFTGLTWLGPAGGLWAEVDVARSPKEMGWCLVEGPGFGVPGPLLVDPTGESDGSSGSQHIKIRWMKDPPIFQCMIERHKTVHDLRKCLSARTSLHLKEIVLTKGLPGDAPNGLGRLPMDYTPLKDVLKDEWTIGKANIQDTLNLVYIGHFDEDYAPQ